VITACGTKKSAPPAPSPCEAIKPSVSAAVLDESSRKNEKVAEWAKTHIDEGVAVFFEACKAKHWEQASIDCIVAANPRTFGACINAMSFEQTSDLNMRVRHFKSRMKADLGE
jgi:hypothetical protein